MKSGDNKDYIYQNESIEKIYNSCITIADLFAGIGGFHYAFKQAIESQNIKYETVLVSEIDNYAKDVYEQNFKFNKENIIDINNINQYVSNNSLNNKIDIVFCGFPCQSFSTAGNRKGFDDKERGGLIFKVIDFVKKQKPKIVLLENVKHIVNHNQGKTFKTIINEFNSLGYITIQDIFKSPLILSPKDFGLKQSRERVFIPLVDKKQLNISQDVNNIGSSELIKKSIEKIETNIFEKKYDSKFKLENRDPETYKSLIAWEEFVNHFLKLKKKIPVIWLDELLDKKYKSISKSTNKDWYCSYISNMKKFYNENKDFIDQWAKKHDVLKWKLRRNKKLEWQAGLDTNFNNTYLQLRQSGFRFRKNTSFPTLVATVQVPLINDNGIWRYLTPRENANLQNFPKDHKICKNDHQAYKQYGNSINVHVAKKIIETFLLDYIKEIYVKKFKN